jgi:hypothetical protein
MLAVDFEEQILPDTFEYSIHYLGETNPVLPEPDMEIAPS